MSEERARMIGVLAYLAYLTGVIWILLPEHKRQALMMRLAGRAEATARRSARRAAEASIGVEVRTGIQLYGVPLALGRLGDVFAELYRSGRPA